MARWVRSPHRERRGAHSAIQGHRKGTANMECFTVHVGGAEGAVTLVPRHPIGDKNAPFASDQHFLKSMWREHCGGTVSLAWRDPVMGGWWEVRESEDCDAVFLLWHAGDTLLRLISDPLGWWEDSIVIHTVLYSESMASEEAEPLVHVAHRMYKGNP